MNTVPPPNYLPRPSGPGYFPSTGQRPGYGRLEVNPPPNRPLPPPAPTYFRGWSSQSSPGPTTEYAPFTEMPAAGAPTIEGPPASAPKPVPSSATEPAARVRLRCVFQSGLLIFDFNLRASNKGAGRILYVSCDAASATWFMSLFHHGGIRPGNSLGK